MFHVKIFVSVTFSTHFVLCFALPTENKSRKFILFYFLFWARAKCALRCWLVWSFFQKGEVTNGAFPWPQTILKQLEEWQVIVSCDQLGETLRAALHYSLFKNPRFCQTKILFKIKTLNCENDSFSLEEIITSYFFSLDHCQNKILQNG